MEGSEVIGLKLDEIQKKPEQVRLIFENTASKDRYVMAFDGMLFETSGSTLNQVVKDVRFEHVIGFRAASQLRHLNQDPRHYRQMLIQMHGSTDENKRELLGVYKNNKISFRRR